MVEGRVHKPGLGRGQDEQTIMMDVSAFFLSWHGLVGMIVMMFLMELPDLIDEWYDKKKK